MQWGIGALFQDMKILMFVGAMVHLTTIFGENRMHCGATVHWNSFSAMNRNAPFSVETVHFCNGTGFV